MEGGLPPLVAHLMGDISHFKGEMSKASAVAKTETEASSKHFNQLATVGKFAFLGIAGAAIAGGAASVKMAGDYEAATTRLITSAGETRANIELVRKGMLQMAGDVGTSAMDLAKGMYIVESAGYHGAAGLQVLRAAAEGAKTENAALDVVANAVTSVLQDYHLKASDAAMVTTKLVAAISVGKTTFQEFTGALHSVLPIASAAHISIADVTGALASMTVHGYSAEQASQNLAHAIQHLQTVTPAQAKEFFLLGLDAMKLKDELGTKGLTGTMQTISDAIMHKMGPDQTHVILDLFKALSQLSPEVQKLGRAAIDGSMTMGDYAKATKGLSVEAAGQAGQFATLLKSTHGLGMNQKNGQEIVQNYAEALKKATGDSTSLNVALMLTGENADYTNKAVKAVSDASVEAGNHVRGWSEIQATFNNHLDRGRERTAALAITIGTALIPYVIKAMGGFTDLVDWLGRTQAVSIPLAVVLGTVLVVAIGAYTVSMIGAAVATIAATWPILAILAAAALLLSGLVLLSGGMGKLTEHLGQIWTAAQTVAKTAWPALQAAGKELWASIQPILGSLQLLTEREDDNAAHARRLQGSIDDTRDSFVRFMTSEGVINFETWLAIRLPHDILVAASFLAVLSTGVEQLMNHLVTIIRVASKLINRDWQGAWDEMNAGMERNKKLTLDGADALKTGLTAIQEEQDGTLEKREAAFRDHMLHLFDETRSGGVAIVSHMRDEMVDRYGQMTATTLTQTRQMKENNLQQMREMQDQAVGHSIIPDMVASILRTFQGLTDKMLGIGQSIGSGLIAGIQSMTNAGEGAVGQFVTDLVNQAKAAAGAHSPSMVFAREVGIPIAEGVALGIQQGAPTAYRSMGGLIGGLSGSGGGGMSAAAYAGSSAPSLTMEDTNQLLVDLWHLLDNRLPRPAGPTLTTQAYARP
jgi:hypothetical protein